MKHITGLFWAFTTVAAAALGVIKLFAYVVERAS